jgi:hypothetical protein
LQDLSTAAAGDVSLPPSVTKATRTPFLGSVVLAKVIFMRESLFLIVLVHSGLCSRLQLSALTWNLPCDTMIRQKPQFGRFDLQKQPFTAAVKPVNDV